MAYQQKEGQGSLFRNEKQNERQPDFRGTILIKGITYNISAWNRTSQNGREYISLQAEERTQDGQQGGWQSRQEYQSRPSSYQDSSYHSPSYQTSEAPGNFTPSSFAPGTFPPAPSTDDIPPFSNEEDLPF